MPIRQKKFELSPRLKFAVGRGYSQNKILKLSAGLCLLLAIVLAGHATYVIFSHEANPLQKATPQVLGASDDQSVAVTQEPLSYTVQQGDTLFNISQSYNISWTTLATLNNLKSPYTLKSGQVIKIPR